MLRWGWLGTRQRQLVVTNVVKFCRIFQIFANSLSKNTPTPVYWMFLESEEITFIVGAVISRDHTVWVGKFRKSKRRSRAANEMPTTSKICCYNIYTYLPNFLITQVFLDVGKQNVLSMIIPIWNFGKWFLTFII